MVDPQICGGKPCIRGTRIMVKPILGMLADGYAMEQILRAYPELSRDEVVAALDDASAVVDEEKVVALGADEPGQVAPRTARCQHGCHPTS
ncbi:MAG TPA: DUF433 domain-containing protein [Actinomycetes bacterium]|jgi:uncharacterized protein (DUF433 family)|nr:DUF433 domain-containing protein [Actinomycetes bacterium]